MTLVSSCQVFREGGGLPAMPSACGPTEPGEQRPPVHRETTCMPEWLKVILCCSPGSRVGPGPGTHGRHPGAEGPLGGAGALSTVPTTALPGLSPGGGAELLVLRRSARLLMPLGPSAPGHRHSTALTLLVVSSG